MPYADASAQREYQRRWMTQRRAAFFHGKTCEWCQSKGPLELHHRDPSKKESHSIWSWGEKRRLTEIAKCIVLCVGCHRRAHSEVRKLESELRNPHGTVRRYWNGCRCEPCRESHRAYNREHPPKRKAA